MSPRNNETSFNEISYEQETEGQNVVAEMAEINQSALIPDDRHDLRHAYYLLTSDNPLDQAALRTIPIAEYTKRELRSLGIDV